PGQLAPWLRRQRKLDLPAHASASGHPTKRWRRIDRNRIRIRLWNRDRYNRHRNHASANPNTCPRAGPHAAWPSSSQEDARGRSPSEEGQARRHTAQAQARAAQTQSSAQTQGSGAQAQGRGTQAWEEGLKVKPGSAAKRRIRLALCNRTHHLTATNEK